MTSSQGIGKVSEVQVKVDGSWKSKSQMRIIAKGKREEENYLVLFKNLHLKPSVKNGTESRLMTQYREEKRKKVKGKGKEYLVGKKEMETNKIE